MTIVECPMRVRPARLSQRRGLLVVIRNLELHKSISSADIFCCAWIPVSLWRAGNPKGKQCSVWCEVAYSNWRERSLCFCCSYLEMAQRSADTSEKVQKRHGNVPGQCVGKNAQVHADQLKRQCMTGLEFTYNHASRRHLSAWLLSR